MSVIAGILPCSTKRSYSFSPKESMVIHMNKTIVIVFACLIVLGGCLYGAVLFSAPKAPALPTSEPEEDISVNGTQEYYTDMITLDSPLPYATVNNPLLITGQARGSWFFEASFPVYLLDSHGNMLGQGVAQAQDDWMTNDFVPFETTITFTADPQIAGDAGTLILQKDNPSGLHEDSEAVRVPVIIGE